jgi:hypothetical protein
MSVSRNRPFEACVHPVNLNTASDEDILSIPGAGPRMVREFKNTVPRSQNSSRRRSAVYVGAKETARLWRPRRHSVKTMSRPHG